MRNWLFMGQEQLELRFGCGVVKKRRKERKDTLHPSRTPRPVAVVEIQPFALQYERSHAILQRKRRGEKSAVTQILHLPAALNLRG